MKANLEHIQLVFIVSRGRSGSTLLQSILDADPNICAPIESKFVLHLNTKYSHIIDWNDSVIKSFINDTFTNRKFRLFWNVTPNELTILFSKYEVKTFSDACKIIYLSHHSMFQKEEIKLIVDKNPLHSRFASEFLSIFPDAKFIHLVRDPRAVTSSHIKSLKQRHSSQLAYEWRLLNEKIEAFKKLNSSIFHTIKYEEFVKTPEREATKLFEFIDLIYSPEILDANITIRSKYQSSTYLSLSQHQSIRSPISIDKIDDWKNKLDQKEIRIINLICHNQLDLYGYSYNPLEKKYVDNLIIYRGRMISNIKNGTLYTLFKIPFPIRSFLYSIISSIKDKKYEH